ncbi:MAG: hypothetical protein HYV59_09665 [Planctomycetes bacterium]|nr:hypothetical protein [Planctomycetota bacterium]
MGKKKRLLDKYHFPGFRPNAEIKGIFGDAKAHVIRLVRTQKNGVRLLWCGAPELLRQEDADLSGDSAPSVSEMREGETGDVGPWRYRMYQRIEIGLAFRERIGQAIHGEAASEDGSSCSRSNRDRRGIIGYMYRIVVSDLERKRLLWFGGKDRSEDSLEMFYEWLQIYFGTHDEKLVRKFGHLYDSLYLSGFFGLIRNDNMVKFLIKDVKDFIDEVATPKKTRKAVGFLESIERLRANIDPETFSQICKDYEPIDKLHDHTKQVELYNRLKNAAVLALA